MDNMPAHRVVRPTLWLTTACNDASIQKSSQSSCAAHSHQPYAPRCCARYHAAASRRDWLRASDCGVNAKGWQCEFCLGLGSVVLMSRTKHIPWTCVSCRRHNDHKQFMRAGRSLDIRSSIPWCTGPRLR